MRKGARAERAERERVFRDKRRRAPAISILQMGYFTYYVLAMNGTDVS